MGQTITRTLVVSNSGNASFNFTVSESVAWASVNPAGGTINPGSSMNLSVVLDSSQTAGAGTYNTNLSFSGTYNNNPADVNLILNVEPATYELYLPAFFKNESAVQASPVPSLLPFLGLIFLGGWCTKKSRK
jgi:hypothetical protein